MKAYVLTRLRRCAASSVDVGDARAGAGRDPDLRARHVGEPGRPPGAARLLPRRAGVPLPGRLRARRGRRRRRGRSGRHAVRGRRPRLRLREARPHRRRHVRRARRGARGHVRRPRRRTRLPLAEAGTLGLSGITALECVEGVPSGPGDVVVVNGATGGLGTFSVQIAKARGAVVVATARSAPGADLVRSLGATTWSTRARATWSTWSAQRRSGRRRRLRRPGASTPTRW